MEGPDLLQAGGSAPDVKSALREIMRARPGQWSLDELSREIQMRGWVSLTYPFTARQGVQLAAARLVATGEAEWARPRVIRYLGRPSDRSKISRVASILS
jgi:hypothetical protein